MYMPAAADCLVAPKHTDRFYSSCKAYLHTHNSLSEQRISWTSWYLSETQGLTELNKSYKIAWTLPVVHRSTLILLYCQSNFGFLEPLLYHYCVLQYDFQLIGAVQIEGQSVVRKAVDMHVDLVLWQQPSLVTVMFPATDMNCDFCIRLSDFTQQPLLHDCHLLNAQRWSDG